MSGDKKIIIIAGPNGAGKSTFAKEYLPKEAGCPIFVNADLIAAGLFPFLPKTVAVRAGRLMVREINEHTQKGNSFSFETTLAGRGYLKKIEKWRAGGYIVKLIFLSLATAEEAMNRVKLRVVQGGHDIPNEVIRRRFYNGLNNFENLYRHRVDYWQHFNNSEKSPILIAKGNHP